MKKLIIALLIVTVLVPLPSFAAKKIKVKKIVPKVEIKSYPCTGKCNSTFRAFA